MGLRHGLAVALGLRIENYIGFRCSRMSQTEFELINRELDYIGLQNQTRLPDFDSLAPLLMTDKKNQGDKIGVTLVNPGTLTPTSMIDPRVFFSLSELKELYNKFKEIME